MRQHVTWASLWLFPIVLGQADLWSLGGGVVDVNTDRSLTFPLGFHGSHLLPHPVLSQMLHFVHHHIQFQAQITYSLNSHCDAPTVNKETRISGASFVHRFTA